MAAVTRVAPLPVTVVGYEVIDRGMSTEVIAKADLITIGASGISKCAAGATECHGIALKGVTAANMLVEYGVQGEMDGFSGLTPGASLYPSASVAGGLDTTVVSYGTTPAVPTPTRIRAVTATRIRYNFT